MDVGQRPLLGAAQDNHAAAHAAITRLCDLLHATGTEARVLHWFFDRDAHLRDDVVYHALTVATDRWVECSLRSVRSAVAKWKNLGVLRMTARQADNGADLPPYASLVWSTVSRLTGGRNSDRCTAAGGPGRAVSRPERGTVPAPDAAFRLPPGAQGETDEDESAGLGSVPTSDSGSMGSVPPTGEYSGSAVDHSPTYGGLGANCTLPRANCTPWVQIAPSPPAISLPNGGLGANAPLLHGAWRAYDHLLTCARGLVVSCSVVVVVDDYNNHKQTSWKDTRALAAELAEQVWGRGCFPQGSDAVRLCALTLIGQLLFSPDTLREAAAATRIARTAPRAEDRPKTLIGYFEGCMANLAVSREGVDLPDGEDRDSKRARRRFIERLTESSRPIVAEPLRQAEALAKAQWAARTSEELQASTPAQIEAGRRFEEEYAQRKARRARESHVAQAAGAAGGGTEAEGVGCGAQGVKTGHSPLTTGHCSHATTPRPP